jgi:hypothetical protein
LCVLEVGVHYEGEVTRGVIFAIMAAGTHPPGQNLLVLYHYCPAGVLSEDAAKYAQTYAIGNRSVAKDEQTYHQDLARVWAEHFVQEFLQHGDLPSPEELQPHLTALLDEQKQQEQEQSRKEAKQYFELVDAEPPAGSGLH